ncbi:MAG: rhodanese-like domain-containing protein [Bacteroidales bacterium]|nr:rhodanese-like domain-containing protein [Bacteroidales bacterium]
MKKFLKKNIVFLSALLLVIILVIVLVSTRKVDAEYKLKNSELSSILNDSSKFISPVSLYKQMKDNSKGLVLVDVRNADAFFRGHIEGALNIPANKLLDEEVVAFFRKLQKDGQTCVLYGDDQLEANGPWLLLEQTGTQNVKVLLGGYSFYSRLPLSDSLLNTSRSSIYTEMSILDISVMKQASATAETKKEEVVKAKQTVVPVKKEVSSGGGC